MVLPDKLYNVLKWLVILVLPALATFYGTIAPIWNWGFVDEVPKTIIAIETFLGAILGFTGFNYEQKKKDELKQAKILNKQEDK